MNDILSLLLETTKGGIFPFPISRNSCSRYKFEILKLNL